MIFFSVFLLILIPPFLRPGSVGTGTAAIFSRTVIFAEGEKALPAHRADSRPCRCPVFRFGVGILPCVPTTVGAEHLGSAAQVFHNGFTTLWTESLDCLRCQFVKTVFDLVIVHGSSNTSPLCFCGHFAVGADFRASCCAEIQPVLRKSTVFDSVFDVVYSAQFCENGVLRFCAAVQTTLNTGANESTPKPAENIRNPLIFVCFGSSRQMETAGARSPRPFQIYIFSFCDQAGWPPAYQFRGFAQKGGRRSPCESPTEMQTAPRRGQ